MAILFTEARKNRVSILKYNHNHGKDGKFAPSGQNVTGDGDSGLSFEQVDMNEDTSGYNFAQMDEYMTRYSGEKITVGGKTYQDMSETDYWAYLNKQGPTREKPMDKDTAEAVRRAQNEYVNNGKSKRINAYLRCGGTEESYREHLKKEGKTDREIEVEMYLMKESLKDDLIGELDKATHADTLKKEVMLTRMNDIQSVYAIGEDVERAVKSGKWDLQSVQAIADQINKHTGKMLRNPGYMSASMASELNYFRDRPVRVSILTPEGTHALVTDNEGESEVVLGRNKKLELVGAQPVMGDKDYQLNVIYRIPDDVEKSAEESIEKYNHNHGKDGKFVGAGHNVTGDGGKTPEAEAKESTESVADLKKRQFKIVTAGNPAPNSYQTWIRSVDDIKTFAETLQPENLANEGFEPGDDYTDDYTWADAQKALKTGKIRIYSSHPITNGIFVTPSREDAVSYGGNPPYSRTVKLEDVAWIDHTQGQFAGGSSLKKSAVRCPQLLMVEPAKRKIIQKMLGLPEEEIIQKADDAQSDLDKIDGEILKYNHNHDANGRFCAAGAGVVVDPNGTSAHSQKVSKLSGEPMHDYSKEIGAKVLSTSEYKEARARLKAAADAFNEADAEKDRAYKNLKQKPKDQWTEDDKFMASIGLPPEEGREEFHAAAQKSDKALEDLQQANKHLKQVIANADGGPKTNADMPEPTPASQKHYPGFKDSTGISFYDDRENLRDHGLKATIVEMSPEEYLERCAANFNTGKETGEGTTTALSQVLGLDKKNIENLAGKMENGTEMDMPYLNVGEGNGGQEGRHRAMAAYNLGLDKIPVLYVTKEDGSIEKSEPMVKVAKMLGFDDSTAKLLGMNSLEEIVKYNPYHGKDGKFTTGGNAKTTVPFKTSQKEMAASMVSNISHTSETHENDISRENESHNNEWFDHIKNERDKLRGEKENKKALYAKKHYFASQTDCIKAMQEGTADELLDTGFNILEKNGDYRPTKPTKGQTSISAEASKVGWDEARLRHICEDTGVDRNKAEEYYQKLKKYFGGSYYEEDRDVIDDFVSKSPAFDGISYRGIAWDKGSKQYDEFMSHVKPGSTIGMRDEPSSWTSLEEIARGFAHAVDSKADSVVIQCVKNRTSTPVAHISSQGEQEILASSTARWTVMYSETTEYQGARKTYIYVVETGPDDGIGKSANGLQDDTVLKMLGVERIDKYNPYHGADGKFTTGGNAKSTVPRKKAAKSEPDSDQRIHRHNPSGELDYALQHRPSRSGRAFDITEKGAIPDDFWEHPDWYSLDGPELRESMVALRKIKDSPDAEVTVYRASPKDELNEGDWVSLSRTYAKGEGRYENVPVHAFKVKAKEIQFAGDSLNEFGFWPSYSDGKEVEKSAIEKYNPYHGKDGKFTTGTAAALVINYKPGKGKAHTGKTTKQHTSNSHGEMKIKAKAEAGSSSWWNHLKEVRKQLDDGDDSDQALYAIDNGFISEDDCIEAFNSGKMKDVLDDGFQLLQQNGDYRPTKPTKGQISIIKEGEREGYIEARLKHMQEDSGLDRGSVEKSLKGLEKYFADETLRKSDQDAAEVYLDRAPAFDGTMYRGIHFGRREDYDEFMKKAGKGATIDMRGRMSSWSSDKAVGLNFAHVGANDEDSVMIVCLHNRTAAPVDHLSTYGEKEVMASSKASWTVLHKEEQTWPSGARKTTIYVVEAGPDGAAGVSKSFDCAVSFDELRFGYSFT